MFVIVSMTEHCISVTDYLSHLVFSKKVWEILACVPVCCVYVFACTCMFYAV